MDLPPFGAWDSGEIGSPEAGPPRRPPQSELESRRTMANLEVRMERQHLLLQTLLRLLMEKGLVQDKEFKEWMAFVDGFDGRVDGRLRPGGEPQSCGSCGRKSPPGYARCQYCGSDFPTEFLEPDRRPAGT